MKPLRGENLKTALGKIYEGRESAWQLKTDAETYHYFTAANRPPRPQSGKGPFRFVVKRTPFDAPNEQLWDTFQGRYPTAAAAWTAQRKATVPGVLVWWWDLHHGKHPETCINDVFKAEVQLYKHHSSGEMGMSPAIMRYSLTQQLLRQDPELYRLAVTLRADGAMTNFTAAVPLPYD